jgi:hypothetical protein
MIFVTGCATTVSVSPAVTEDMLTAVPRECEWPEFRMSPEYPLTEEIIEDMTTKELMAYSDDFYEYSKYLIEIIVIRSAYVEKLENWVSDTQALILSTNQ